MRVSSNNICVASSCWEDPLRSAQFLYLKYMPRLDAHDALNIDRALLGMWRSKKPLKESLFETTYR